MGFCRKSGHFNRIILSSLFTSFALTNISIPCYSETNIAIYDVHFAYKMEQIIEKIYRAAEKENRIKVSNFPKKLVSLKNVQNRKKINRRQLIFSKFYSTSS